MSQITVSVKTLLEQFLCSRICSVGYLVSAKQQSEWHNGCPGNGHSIKGGQDMSKLANGLSWMGFIAVICGAAGLLLLAFAAYREHTSPDLTGHLGSGVFAVGVALFGGIGILAGGLAKLSATTAAGDAQRVRTRRAVSLGTVALCLGTGYLLYLLSGTTG